MIEVTRLNGKDFVLNAELIEVMEETPDTVITLTTGHKYVVKESLDEILDKIFTYKKNATNSFQEKQNAYRNIWCWGTF